MNDMSSAAVAARKFASFSEFYPFYLGEHRNTICKALHFIGTSVALALLVIAIATSTWWLIAVAVVQGYAWAWVGHFGFEKNKPASFKQPLYSFMGDWVMWFQLLTGKLKFSGN
ncbi:MAG: Mpo1-like protein [Casimicrobium sp.]